MVYDVPSIILYWKGIANGRQVQMIYIRYTVVVSTIVTKLSWEKDFVQEKEVQEPLSGFVPCQCLLYTLGIQLRWPSLVDHR